MHIITPRFIVFILLSITFAMQATAQEIIFSDNFESGELNDQYWTVQGNNGKSSGKLVNKLVTTLLSSSDGDDKKDKNEAQFVQVIDRLENVQYIPRSGKYALALSLEKSGRDHIVNTADLNLDLSGVNEAILYFYIRDEGDKSDEDDAILISDDGGRDFKKALQLNPSQWHDHQYGVVTLDLAASAKKLGLSLTDQFVIRFRQGGRYGYTRTLQDGFFIDDVVVLGAPTYVKPPFKDSFETEQLGPAWRIADPYNRGATAMEQQSQWGLVEPVQHLENVQGIPYSGKQALALGLNASIRGHIVNAADLHLDLSRKEEATLRFYLRDEEDNTDEDDAIFLSDNGGSNFTRALDIDPSKRPDKKYEEIIIDLAETAQRLGLKFTDQFIVRFQHGGHYGFTRTLRNGFFIDEVSVEAPLSVKEQVDARIAAGLSQWKTCGKFEKSEDCEARTNNAELIASVEDSLERQALSVLAEDQIDWSTARNTYDADSETFTIIVEGLEPFKVAVPLSEAESLDKSFGEVQFQNAAFSVDEGEALQVIYVEMVNPASGKTYVFDLN